MVCLSTLWYVASTLTLETLAEMRAIDEKETQEVVQKYDEDLQLLLNSGTKLLPNREICFPLLDRLTGVKLGGSARRSSTARLSLSSILSGIRAH
jgi:hypothetical protein